MTDFFFYLFRFLFGGAAYCTIEVIYRGRTHYSMFFAGGIILAAFYCLERTQPDLRLALKCLMGAGIITGVELVFGLIFNCALGMGVWDYSRVPLNLWGQICLPFTLIWLGFSFFTVPFCHSKRSADLNAGHSLPAPAVPASAPPGSRVPAPPGSPSGQRGLSWL